LWQVVPQPLEDFAQEGTLLALDVGRLDPQAVDSSTNRFVTQDKLLAVCERVCEWNATQTYSVVTKNCQDFVNAIFTALDQQPAIPAAGELSEFIKTLSGADEHDVVFKFGKVAFPSHAMLDLFVERHIDTLSTESYNLLKAYDRAFWLRMFAYEEKLDPLTAEERKMYARSQAAKNQDHVMCCPFKNPRMTGTMAYNFNS
jgi:hypothetical protein